MDYVASSLTGSQGLWVHDTPLSAAKACGSKKALPQVVPQIKDKTMYRGRQQPKGWSWIVSGSVNPKHQPDVSTKQ